MNNATAVLWRSAGWREGRGAILSAVIMEQRDITGEALRAGCGGPDTPEKVKTARLTVDGASVLPLLAGGRSFNGWR